MREYNGEKRYKDYLLRRYSISREGHLLKDTHGEVYRIRPKKEGKNYFFFDGVTDLKIDALRFAVLYHYDIWDSVQQLRLKDGDPQQLKGHQYHHKTLVCFTIINRNCDFIFEKLNAEIESCTFGDNHF